MSFNQHEPARSAGEGGESSSKRMRGAESPRRRDIANNVTQLHLVRVGVWVGVRVRVVDCC